MKLAWTIAMSGTHLFRISCTHEWAPGGARCRNPGRQKTACRPETNDAIELYIGFLLIKRWPPVSSARLIWFTIKDVENGGQRSLPTTIGLMLPKQKNRK